MQASVSGSRGPAAAVDGSAPCPSWLSFPRASRDALPWCAPWNRARPCPACSTSSCGACAHASPRCPSQSSSRTLSANASETCAWTSGGGRGLATWSGAGERASETAHALGRDGGRPGPVVGRRHAGRERVPHGPVHAASRSASGRPLARVSGCDGERGRLDCWNAGPGMASEAWYVCAVV